MEEQRLEERVVRAEEELKEAQAQHNAAVNAASIASKAWVLERDAHFEAGKALAEAKEMQGQKAMQRKKPLKLPKGGNGGGKSGNGGGKTLKELEDEVEKLEEVCKARSVAREGARAAEVAARGRAAIARMTRDGAQQALRKLRAKRAGADEATSSKTPAAAAEAAGTSAEAATFAEETPTRLFGGSTSSDRADNMDEEGSATTRSKRIKRSRWGRWGKDDEFGLVGGWCG